MKLHGYCLMASIFLTVALIFTGQALAGDIDATLTDSAGASSFHVKNAESTNNVLMEVQSDGKVGIGTTTPDEKLDVSGNVQIGVTNGKLVFPSSHYNEKIELYKGGDEKIGTSDNQLMLIAGTGVTDNIAFFGASTEVMRVETGDGNVGIGTTDQFGGGLGVLSLGNAATNPSSTLSAAAALYASAGELFAYDAAGNATQISPHDPQTGEWIFYSKNTKTGRVVRINMEKLVKKIEELTGEQFMEEWIEEVKK